MGRCHSRTRTFFLTIIYKRNHEVFLECLLSVRVVSSGYSVYLCKITNKIVHAKTHTQSISFHPSILSNVFMVASFFSLTCFSGNNSSSYSSFPLSHCWFFFITLALSCVALFLGRCKDFRSYTLIDTMMKFIIPNFTRDTRFSLNSFLTGFIICQWTWTGFDTILSDLRHRINWFFVRLSL